MPTLAPLKCATCGTSIPAETNEVAWRCAQCGQGWLLDESTATLRPGVFNFAAGLKPTQPNRPFWVLRGQVTITKRETYSGNRLRDAQVFWARPYYFFIPAFAMPLDVMAQMGKEMLNENFSAQPGAPTPFHPVTILPQDVRPLAEFIVFGIEANRDDQLKSVDYTLELGEAELWVLA